jgi:formylmethanofuran dehydrogenase subunit C
VSDFVQLTMRGAITERVELDGVTADRLSELAESEIAALPVHVGRHAAQLGDLFDVRGGRSSRVRVAGDLTHVDGLASRTSGGEMIVEGAVGDRVGAGMSSGWVDIRGDAGDDAGVAMSGGALRIVGNAGSRVGAAAPGASKGMSGGELIVNGNAGDEVAARVRRGLVVVAGDVGSNAGRAIIAGTLLAFGRVGHAPGHGSKRGSIVALGAIAVPDTYRYACTYQPTYLRMLFTYLRRRYGLAVEDEAFSGQYRRYCGDLGGAGKGEILHLQR